MDQEEVVTLMKSSQSKAEWNANCNRVRAACGGYPEFWYQAVILSGIVDQVAAKWGGSGKIEIFTE